MTGVVCASALDQLMDYLEGAAPADVRGAIEAHLATCERCTAFVASYRETPRILREATAVELPAERARTMRAFLRARRN